MKKLSPEKRTKLMAVAGLTLLIMVGLWFGLISPQTQKLRSLADRKTAAATKLEQINRAIATGPTLKEQLEKENGKLAEREANMATGDLNSWAFNTIRKFKTPYNKIDIPQFGRIDGPKDCAMIPKFPYKQASVTVAGSADYFELGRFIADFENAFPYFRIANLSLEPSTGAAATEPERLAFKLDVIALVRPNNT